MKALRGAASIVAGFLALPVLMRISLGAVLTVRPDLVPPSGPPPGTYLAVNLGLAAVMGTLSAALTARLAPEPPFLWALLLAFLVFAGGLVFGVQQMGSAAPGWYLLGMPLISGLSIAFGGWAYLEWRQRRDDA